MNIEHIEIEHNKKITVMFSLLLFIIIAGLAVCGALVVINFVVFLNKIGMGMTIILIVVLSLCTILFCVLLLNQVVKLHRKIIFIADENGICDYSRCIVLQPIAYSEIRSIEYKAFLDNDIEASELRHLKITLKDKRTYMRKLNLLQKLSFFFSFNHIELHLFCGKVKVKKLVNKLQHNLEIYNQTTNMKK